MGFISAFKGLTMTLDGGGGDVFCSVRHDGTEPSCSSDMWMIQLWFGRMD
jgi:hypothetical protein